MRERERERERDTLQGLYKDKKDSSTDKEAKDKKRVCYGNP